MVTTGVPIRAMRQDEFVVFLDDAVPEYARQKVAAGAWSEHDAERLSRESYGQLLPDGPTSEGMLLLVAEQPDATTAGWVLVGLAGPKDPSRAWIYNLTVRPEARRRGYARALLDAAAQAVADRGIAELELNVFGYNTAARALYESSGYETVALTMRRQVTSAAVSSLRTSPTD